MWLLLLKILRRIFYRYNKFSFLNLTGLAVGFTFLNLIAVFTIQSYTYDRFHRKLSSLYLLEMNLHKEDGSFETSKYVSLDQLFSMQKEIPEIKNSSFLNYSYFDWDNGAFLLYNNQKFQLPHVAFTDENFPKLFSFPVVRGNLALALKEPGSMVLSQNFATRIFGDQNPIGKMILLNNQPFTINAIIESFSDQSSLNIDGLVNYRSYKTFTGSPLEDFSNLLFLEIPEPENIRNTEKKIRNLFLNQLPAEEKLQIQDNLSIRMVPFQDNYFNQAAVFDPMKHGNKLLVNLILGTGLMILFLALINYINLFFANSLRRQKEITIHSISGATSNNIMFQFLLESILISLLAFAFSLVLSLLILPWFNLIIDYPIQAQTLFSPLNFFSILLISLVTGILAGLISVAYTFHHQSVPKAGRNYSPGNHYLLKNLVIFQVSMALILIILTLGIYKQIHFATTSDQGIASQNVLTLPVYKLGEKKKVFLQMVNNHAQTINQAQSSTYLNTFNRWGGTLYQEGLKRDISYYVIHANSNFLNTLNLRLIQGRNFIPGDSIDQGACLINETALRQFGFRTNSNANIDGHPIVGVVNDFHIQSFHFPLAPMVIFNAPENKTGLTTLRFHAENNQQVKGYLLYLKKCWNQLNPDQPFEYEFISQQIKTMYQQDFKLMQTFSGFTILALIIASLGLFGLVSFKCELKIKEIGIRRVNGAGIFQILQLLNLDFIRWFIISFIIACPIAWVILHNWLKQFAYKTEIPWWIYLLAGIAILSLSLGTVTLQIWRAASRNPVESLRYE